MSIPVEANCNQIDSGRCDQHFSKGRWSHHINDFVVEEIILYLAKVCQKTFLLIYSRKRNCIPLYLKNYVNIFLRYTSIHSYKMLLEDFPSPSLSLSYKMLLEDFPLPSLSLISKISKGKIDDIKCAQKGWSNI